MPSHLNNRGPDRPDIRRVGYVSTLLDDLRCHPWHRARDSPQRVLERVGLDAVQLLGAPEVRELGHPAVRDQHVGTFHVPVHDAHAVEVVDPQHDLRHQPPDQVLAEDPELHQHAVGVGGGEGLGRKKTGLFQSGQASYLLWT